jgi:hypothetical protein
MSNSIQIDQFPYRHAGEALGFAVETYDLDTGETGGPDGQQYVSLPEESDWETGELSVTVNVEDDILAKVFPPVESNEGALVVVGYCPTNHHRFASVVAKPPLTAGSVTDTVELVHEDLRGRVTLTPYLVRTEGRADGDDYAHRIGNKLASGPTWTVDVDEPSSGHSSDLDVRTKSFSDPDFPANEANTWYVDITDSSSPKLYINKDHAYVAPLIDEDTTQTFRGRVRSVVLDMVGIPMLVEFVVKAAELAVNRGEIRYEWQERMLTDVCGEVFGDDPDPEDIEEMLKPGSLSATLNDIENAVQRRRSPHENIKRLLELNT